MTTVYNRIGTGIMVNAIVYAKDVDDVATFIYHELERRGLSRTAGTGITANAPARGINMTYMYNNLQRAGYGGAAPSAQIPTASEIKAYVNYAKQLYLKILRA